MNTMVANTSLKNTVVGANMFINDQYGAIWYLNGNYWDVVVLEHLRGDYTRDDIYIRLSL
jgi:hypothetical protein